ncbi:MAG: metallophosphoesterase [Deltaproteobacteria bacterium]|nr:metallophosphoesterase [Deltaproteobacteria bacterium]
MTPSIFAIGDIHGCLDKLEDLLAKINATSDDTLIFLGDYIDRGDASKDVVDLLIEVASEIRCIFLRGNHEDMFLEFIEYGTNRLMYFSNGGDMTVESYTRGEPHQSVVDALPEAHKDFFYGLRWYYEDDNYIYVHAGIRPGIPLNLQVYSDLIWIRDDFIFSPTDLDKKVIFGHTPFTVPLIKPDKIGIDTGAVYGGALTAVRLPELEFIQSFI